MKLYKTNERPLMLALLVILICFAGVQTVSASDDWLISGNKITGSDVGSILVKFDNNNYDVILGFTFIGDFYVTTSIGDGNPIFLGQPSDGFPFSIERISNNVIVTVPTGSKTYTVPLDVGFSEVVYDETLWNLTFGNPEPEPELLLSPDTISSPQWVSATVINPPDGHYQTAWYLNGLLQSPIHFAGSGLITRGFWIGSNTTIEAMLQPGSVSATADVVFTTGSVPGKYQPIIIPMPEPRNEFIRQQQQEIINSTPLIGAHLLALTDTIDHYGSGFFNMTMNTTSLLLSPLTAMNYHLNSAITTFEDVGTMAIEGTGLSFLMQVSNRVLSAIPPIIINLISLALIGDTIYLFLNRQV